MNDGLVDSRLDTPYPTAAWNVLAQNDKSFGIGWTSSVTARMAIHLRNARSCGNHARGATKPVMENSCFDGVGRGSNTGRSGIVR